MGCRDLTQGSSAQDLWAIPGQLGKDLIVNESSAFTKAGTKSKAAEQKQVSSKVDFFFGVCAMRVLQVSKLARSPVVTGLWLD